jgi:hypothetical protein
MGSAELQVVPGPLCWRWQVRWEQILPGHRHHLHVDMHGQATCSKSIESTL